MKRQTQAKNPTKRAFARLQGEGGYVLILAMLVLMAIGMVSVVLFSQLVINQQHVRSDRAYNQSLAVAEAGLNQALWMVSTGEASDANNFAIPGNTGPDPHKKTYTLTDTNDGTTLGTYTLQLTPPSLTSPGVGVTVTGQANSTEEAARTVTAYLGRPSFSEYLLLVDDTVYIGGPATRIWHGKTHSNAGVRIETANIVETVSCALAKYNGSGSKGGVYSTNLPSNSPSKALWKFPVPEIDFDTVTFDLSRLSALASAGGANLPYVNPTATGKAHGWYIKLLPNGQYKKAKVTDEYESKSYTSGTKYGGYLTYETLPSTATNYPANGVIYVNDNVWIEGTGLTGRITIASSGQMNAEGKRDATSIHIVGDLTYATKGSSACVGLVAENNIEIPMYAPYMKGGTTSQQDMEIDAAMIAQQGAEFVNRDATPSNDASKWGPKRDMLTFYGAIASRGTPSRETESGSNYCGFAEGTNTYDPMLLHNPPPHFPLVGSFQILEWQELPSAQAVQ